MTERLTRTADFTVVRATDEGDGLTLEGYAAVFGVPTRIDSFEGKFDEIVAPGAFKRTIGAKGPSGIRLQFDHGRHPFIGSIPIGAIEVLREDARGLFVRARLFDNDLVRPVRDAIDGGAISGMSFQFRVLGEDWDESGDIPVRTIREVELFELGPVVWPAYDTTSVGVRAAEVARDLSQDQDFRDQVMRALIAAGTSLEPAVEGTSVEPAAESDDPPEGTRRDRTDDHTRVSSDISEFLRERERKDAA
jgi:uncharacterized protein